MNNIYEKQKEPKIFIVDDNPSNVKLLERILRIDGYVNIKTLTDSTRALIVFEEYQPDLMLLDLQMPHFDGFDILDFLKKEAKLDYMPIIVITAQDEKENRLKALELGARDFIGKPFDCADVLQRVNNFLNAKLNGIESISENATLEKTFKIKESELSETKKELIERLLWAVEFSDKDASEKVARIKKYTYVLAKKLGMSNEQALEISNASLVYDIDEIGVPDSMLKKKGVLEPSEWEHMKNHAANGAETLSVSNLEVLKLAVKILQTCHENWDGSGHPEGLVGNKIPVAGRIVGLVSAFDEMTCCNDDGSIWKIEDAIEYIISQKGMKFDPDLVDVLVENINELLKVV